MKSIFKATAILGSSSAIGAVVGIVSAKMWAITVGPAGIGYLSMQLSVLGLVTLIAGLGIGAGIVRLGAKAIAEDDKLGIAANQKAVIVISLAAGIVGVLILFVFGDPINRTFLDDKSSGREVAALGIALIFSLLTSAFTSILNAHQNVKALAKFTVISNTLGSVVLIACLWARGIEGIVTGIILSSLFGCLTSYYFYKREINIEPVVVPREKLFETIKSLLKFGIPFTGSMIVGTGVQMVLPILILHNLGLESIGFYRAASSIAVTSLALVMGAMVQDYYPRLSAASGEPQELITIINQQLYLLFVLLAPVILWLLFLSPVVVPLLYSTKFSDSAEILNWFLVGDVFRLLSWSLSFVILARSKSSVFFFIELFGGATSLVTSLLGMQWFGTKGLGISYLATYFLYYLLVLFLVRRQIGFAYSRENKFLALSTLASAIGISVLTVYGETNLRNGFALLVCLIYTGVSFFIVKKHFFHDQPEEKQLA